MCFYNSVLIHVCNSYCNHDIDSKIVFLVSRYSNFFSIVILGFSITIIYANLSSKTTPNKALFSPLRSVHKCFSLASVKIE